MSTTSDKGISYYDEAEAASASSAGSAEKAKPLIDVAALSLRSRLSSEPTGTLLVMVGLPARGKSFISAKLFSFVKWGGRSIKVFNVGSYRRQEGEKETERSANSGASFFDDKNAVATQKREELASAVLGIALEWLVESDGRVAIFDATNSTRERRYAIAEKVEDFYFRKNLESSEKKKSPARIIFVESICDDQRVLEHNMRIKARASPDFKAMPFEDALRDLKNRLAHYESRYQPVMDHEGAYIKSYNFSSKVTSHLCFGRMSKTILPFLIALHTDDRPVYLCALPPTASEPETVLLQREPKTPVPLNDDDFGDRLADFWWNAKKRTLSQLQTESKVLILSSTMPRAVAAAKKVQARNPDLATVVHSSALNPLLLSSTHPCFNCDASNGDDDDDNNIASSDSDDPSSKKRKNFFDRGEDGESYADLVARLESTVLDLEASVDPVLIVTHATPARALRAYFKNIDVFRLATHPSGPEALALADAAPAVLECNQTMSGNYTEHIHWI